MSSSGCVFEKLLINQRVIIKYNLNQGLLSLDRVWP